MSEQIDDAKRALGRALAGLRTAGGWTQQRLAASTFVDRSYVAHAESGRVIPNERFWVDADAALGAGGDLISGFERLAATRDRATRETTAGSGPAPAGNAGAGSAGANRSTRDVADESLAFANRAAASNLNEVTLEYLRCEVSRLAIAYVHADLPPVFLDLVAARDEMFGLLDGHQRPRHTRELYFLAGATCLMLAQASRDLGDPRAELAQLRCAWTCVDLADHPGLRAWAQGTAARQVEGSGQPRRAMALAAEALGATGGSPGSRVRLAAVRARAAARAGDRATALAAAALAAAPADGPPDELDALGGILTFPEAKRLFYLGGTFALLGDHTTAERHARAAVARYENGPVAERSYGDEGLARLDIAAARLHDGDVDSAREALGPVLALPASRRIAEFHPALAGTRDLLRRPGFTGSAAARSLLDEVRGYLDQPTGGALPSTG